MQFATREQIQQVHNLGSDRNALAILKDMKDYMHVRHIGRLNVYYLNELGRGVIGSESEMKWNTHVEHTLARNEVYIHFGLPADWKNECPIILKGKESIKLIPDAIFTVSGIYHFLEVDRTQNMKENKNKLRLYSKIIPIISSNYGYVPKLIFYTSTVQRQIRLKDMCSELKLPITTLIKEDFH